MKRREFIERSFKAGIAAGATLSALNSSSLLAFSNSGRYDLTAVKGAEPDVMFDEGMRVLGGMKSFVKKGQSVVVKPNIGWDVVPENAANTNPLLINRIIKHCYEAGAKEVFVFDHTCDDWRRSYKNSGIEKAASDAKAKIVSGNSEGYYQKVEIKNGKSLTSAKVHELILESDVFINVPILKNHGSTQLTIGMKNLMGIVWDRGYWHRNNLHQCIADFASFRKPDLNIVDAYYVMKRNGPRGTSKADVITMKSQIISTDIVAADTAAAKLFGSEPKDINYIKYADELGLGKMDLSGLNVYRKIF